MKILILGCGYLGLAAGKMLHNLGHTITATTRSQEKRPFLKTLFGNSLLWDPASYLKAFENQDIVLFLAAPDSPAEYKETYLENAKRIQIALNHFPKIQKVIYTSSTSVYGEHGGRPVDESTPLAPQNPSAKILIETEETLLETKKACIFRLGELIGPGRLLEERLKNLTGPLPGTGDAITNFSPLEDVLAALLFAIEKPAFGIYNLVSDLHIPRKELYEKLAKLGKIPPITWDPQKTSLHGGNKWVLSDKLKNAGFTFLKSV